MKIKLSLLSFALCFAAGTAFSATTVNPSLFMGSWKLNEAKSNIENGSGKNRMVVYSAAGTNVRVVVDGTDTRGKPSHSEWIGKFDRRDYRVTGDSTSDVRSYHPVNDRTMDFTAKYHGTVTMTGRIVISADGKTRTVSTQRVDVNGKRFGSRAVYQKQ